MAYGCGYFGGYSEDTCNLGGLSCGGGYGGAPFAALMYGGGIPCYGQNPGSAADIQSNVEEYCILDSSCF